MKLTLAAIRRGAGRLARYSYSSSTGAGFVMTALKDETMPDNVFALPADNDHGMSLPEVLAAIVVLTLGILGLAPMMAISIDGNTHADNVTTVIASA